MMADTSKLPISRVDELIDKLNEINNNFNIINNKLDSMKYVIESGSNENNTQWYRKWNDGWIEQGGIYNYGSFIKDLGGANINFLINFSNVNYQIFATSFRTDKDNEGNGLCTAMMGFYSFKNDSVKIRWYINSTYNESIQMANWYACGY